MLKGWQFILRPSDIDIIRWISLKEPHRDLNDVAATDSAVGSALKGMLEARAHRQSMGSLVSRSESRRSSVISIEPRLNKTYAGVRSASRVDMATGTTSMDRGFDFATEEGGGVTVQRIQTNLSERREKLRGRKSSIMKGKEALSHVLSLKRMKKKPPSRE
jgi:phospholipid-translocating ATPase